MKNQALLLSVVLLFAISSAQAAPKPAVVQETVPRPSGPKQQKLVPGMANYTDQILFGEVWPGAGLSPRDRSLIVISALIATSKPVQLQGHLGRALTNGVTPVEASGVLTHLAFYAGWPNAVSALDVYDQVYADRKVDLTGLQEAFPKLPPMRSNGAASTQLPGLGSVAPRFSDLSTRVIEDDLWRRSDLSLRDRSLVTIAALTVMGDADLLEPYLRRGVEAGLTRDEIAEAITHLAFYGGWGKATNGLQELEATFGAAPETKAFIQRKGSGPVTPGPAQNFTGNVKVSAPFSGNGGSRVRGATVSFEAGARSAWHTHPMGQTLILTEGCGWTQAEGGPIEKICAGDVAWIGPGQKHWHGATATTAMTHVAVSETVEGGNVVWLEKVSDEHYSRGPK